MYMFAERKAVVRCTLCCVLLLLILPATPLNAQENGKVVAHEVPTLPLVYSEPLKTGLLMPGTELGSTFHCADDGSIVFHTTSFSMEHGAPPIIVVYSVKPQSGASPIRFDPVTSGLHRISTGMVAVSPSRLAMMVSATKAEDTATYNKNPAPHSYLLLFDRSGSFLRATSLDEFSVKSRPGVGIFDSGELLILAGSSASHGGLRWVLMKEDGSDMRTLAPDQAETKTPEGKSHQIKHLSGMPQIVPYRGHLLVMEMNTRGPIYEVSASGDIKAVVLKLPEGESLGQFIPSDGTTWKVILSHANADAHVHAGAPSSFLLDKIAEFDPESGELLRYIDTGEEHHPLVIACEERGEYLGVHIDPQDGALTIIKGVPGH